MFPEWMLLVSQHSSRAKSEAVAAGLHTGVTDPYLKVKHARRSSSRELRGVVGLSVAWGAHRLQTNSHLTSVSEALETHVVEDGDILTRVASRVGKLLAQ